MADEFPGQIDQLESYIRILENEQTSLLQQIRQMREKIAELESQVYGGSTK
jgi:hypothetical protein